MENEKTLEWRDYIVTLIFFVLNVIGYVWCVRSGDMAYTKGSMNAGSVIVDRQYYRFLTCMFLHVDIGHIVSNMIFLIGLGQMVETAVGHVRFAVLYLLSGLGASVFSFLYAVFVGDPRNSIGASGAVFGLIGALLIIVLIHHGRYKGVSAGRLVFAIAYMIYSGARAVGIDNAAHVGGLLCGTVVSAVMYLCRRKDYRGLYR